MTLLSRTYWGGAPFHFRRPPGGARLESRVLRTEDLRDVRALLWTPREGRSPRVAALFMHPRVDFTHHYAIPRLVEAGVACLGALSRSPNNDVDLEHELLLLDVAACVRFLRERGAEKIVLFGNSGGGALFGFYQAEACRPKGERIARTPGGTRTMLPSAEMPPADAMIYVAAHRGPGQVLAECIDPAVTDEADPLATDASIDMYDPKNGFRPPPEWSTYPDEFVARYRSAQRERVARLDALARALLADKREASAACKAPNFSARPLEEKTRLERRRAFEPLMVIHRTMANLHYTDRHLDPSGREYGSLLSDRPDLMNMAHMGFARVVTPRAFLSTWSFLSSNADLASNVRTIEAPTLVVSAGRDREIFPDTDARPLFEAVASKDKTWLTFENARHYFEPDLGEQEAPDVEALMDAVVPWIEERLA